MKTQFENAAQMARDHPETFKRPSLDEITLLDSGTHVLICAARERFWVEITEIKLPLFKGVIENDLLHTEEHGLVDGDAVEFHGDHIYKIYTGW